MRDSAVTLLGLMMVLYVFYRAVVTFAFLPLADGFFYGHIGFYYMLLLLVSIEAIVRVFFEKWLVACLLSGGVALAALASWCYVIFRNRVWVEGYFCCSVLPELLFAACGFTIWMIRRTDAPEPKQEETDD